MFDNEQTKQLEDLIRQAEGNGESYDFIQNTLIPAFVDANEEQPKIKNPQISEPKQITTGTVPAGVTINPIRDFNIAEPSTTSASGMPIAEARTGATPEQIFGAPSVPNVPKKPVVSPNVGTVFSPSTTSTSLPVTAQVKQNVTPGQVFEPQQPVEPERPEITADFSTAPSSTTNTSIQPVEELKPRQEVLSEGKERFTASQKALNALKIGGKATAQAYANIGNLLSKPAELVAQAIASGTGEGKDAVEHATKVKEAYDSFFIPAKEAYEITPREEQILKESGIGGQALVAATEFAGQLPLYVATAGVASPLITSIAKKYGAELVSKNIPVLSKIIGGDEIKAAETIKNVLNNTVTMATVSGTQEAGSQAASGEDMDIGKIATESGKGAFIGAASMGYGKSALKRATTSALGATVATAAVEPVATIRGDATVDLILNGLLMGGMSLIAHRMPKSSKAVEEYKNNPNENSLANAKDAINLEIGQFTPEVRQRIEDIIKKAPKLPQNRIEKASEIAGSIKPIEKAPEITVAEPIEKTGDILKNVPDKPIEMPVAEQPVEQPSITKEQAAHIERLRAEVDAKAKTDAENKQLSSDELAWQGANNSIDFFKKIAYIYDEGKKKYVPTTAELANQYWDDFGSLGRADTRAPEGAVDAFAKSKTIPRAETEVKPVEQPTSTAEVTATAKPANEPIQPTVKAPDLSIEKTEIPVSQNTEKLLPEGGIDARQEKVQTETEVNKPENGLDSENRLVASQSNSAEMSDMTQGAAPKRSISLDDGKRITKSVLKDSELVEVIKNESELPEHWQELIRSRNSSGSVKGLYDPYAKKAYMLTDMYSTPEEFIAGIKHEAQHFGVRELLGNRIKPVYEAIYRKYKGSEVSKKITENYFDDENRKFDELNEEHRNVLVDEILADLAETNKDPKTFAMIVARIKDLLRRAFPDIEWSDNDVRALITRSAKKAREYKEEKPFEETNKLSLIAKKKEKPPKEMSESELEEYWNKPIDITPQKEPTQKPSESKPSADATQRVMEGYDKEQKELASKYKVTPRKVIDVLGKTMVASDYPLRRILEKTPEGKKAIIEHDLSLGANNQSKIISDKAVKEMYKDLPDGYKKQLAVYLKGERILEREKLSINQGREIENPENLSSSDYKAWKEDFKNKNPKEFSEVEKSAKIFWKTAEDQLKELKNEGLISEDFEKYLLDNHKHYYPFKFLQHIDPLSPIGTGTRQGLHDSGIKAIDEGSKGFIVTDPKFLLESIVLRTQNRIFKNRANKQLYEFAKISKGNNLDIKVEEPKYIKTKENELTGELEMTDPMWGDLPAGKDRIIAFIDGKQVGIVASKDIVESWNNSGSIVNNIAIKALSYISGTPILKTFATGINPEFAVTNFARDIMHVWLTTQEYSKAHPFAMFQMAGDIKAIINDAVMRKGRYLDYISEGGGMETMTRQGESLKRSANEPSKTNKLRDNLDNMSDVLGYIGNTSELITRLMLRERAIKNAIKKGMSQKEASKYGTWVARNYIDFAQGGTVGKVLNTFLPYLNAGIQGTRGVFRAGRNDPIGTALKTSQLIAYGALLTGINKQMNPEGWENVSDREKVNKWIIMLPGSYVNKDGKTQYNYIGIPKDQAQRLISAVGSGIIDMGTGGKGDNVAKQMRMAIQDFTPIDPANPPLPPIFSVYTAAKNYDTWTGKKFWYGEKVKPESEKYWETPKEYVELGKILNISPVRTKGAVEKIIPRNIYGDLFSSPLKIEEFLRKSTKDKIKEAPFVRRFFRSTMPEPDINRENFRKLITGVVSKYKSNPKRLNDLKDFISKAKSEGYTDNEISTELIPEFVKRFPDIKISKNNVEIVKDIKKSEIEENSLKSEDNYILQGMIYDLNKSFEKKIPLIQKQYGNDKEAIKKYMKKQKEYLLENLLKEIQVKFKDNPKEMKRLLKRAVTDRIDQSFDDIVENGDIPDMYTENLIKELLPNYDKSGTNIGIDEERTDE